MKTKKITKADKTYSIIENFTKSQTYMSNSAGVGGKIDSFMNRDYERPQKRFTQHFDVFDGSWLLRSD